MRTADAIHRFHLANATVRGHLVRLESVWAMVRDNVDCPSAVGELLGESLVAAALLAGALKFDGRLSIQLRDVGPLKLLFAECSNEGNIRGLARCADEAQLEAWLRRAVLANDVTELLRRERAPSRGRSPSSLVRRR